MLNNSAQSEGRFKPRVRGEINPGIPQGVEEGDMLGAPQGVEDGGMLGVLPGTIVGVYASLLCYPVPWWDTYLPTMLPPLHPGYTTVSSCTSLYTARSWCGLRLQCDRALGSGRE